MEKSIVSENNIIPLNLFKIGDIECIKNLVSKNLIIPSEAFREAMKNNHTELAKYVHLTRNSGISAMRDAYYASKFGDLVILKYIVSLGYNPEYMILEAAASNGKVEIVKYLLSLGLKGNSDTMNIAIEYGHLNVVKILVESGLIISEKELKLSAYHGQADILIYFLNLGYTLNSAPDTSWFVKIKQRRQIIKIYHQLDLKGLYRVDCQLRNCKICHVVIIEKLWELETYEYNSYIQFLPRELAEDLGELLLL